ncbi:hypothetical protein EON65_22850 [archaeon]|nr:MAG: hypothetical protein EON65_22850 [archaeon]
MILFLGSGLCHPETNLAPNDFGPSIKAHHENRKQLIESIDEPSSIPTPSSPTFSPSRSSLGYPSSGPVVPDFTNIISLNADLGKLITEYSK